MKEFQDIVSALNVKTVRYMPGEHDASLDNGEAFQQLFGQTHYTFDHKGVHFIAIDNVSDSKARVGDAQIAWIKADLAALPADVPVVVLTHRPLFDLYPDWDWATRDGAAVMDVLMTRKNLTVFYGHIHQQHHHMTGHIAHHAAESLIFPQPVAGSLPKRIPVAWDNAHPYKGLGFRQIKAEPDEGYYELKELPVVRA
jgi:3',5'-cyclic AMP phosphodiesterase CpdA